MGCKPLYMFIRAVEHKDKKNRRKYRTYKLVDSVRTERGPRQTTVLNLGADFKLPKEHWKELANCIEEIITEQQTIFEYPKKMRTLAEQYARRIIRKQASVIDEEKPSPPDYARVDLPAWQAGRDITHLFFESHEFRLGQKPAPVQGLSQGIIVHGLFPDA